MDNPPDEPTTVHLWIVFADPTNRPRQQRANRRFSRLPVQSITKQPTPTGRRGRRGELSKFSLLDQGGPLARAARRGGPRPPLAPCLRHRLRRPPPTRAAKPEKRAARPAKNPASCPTASTASRSGTPAKSAPVTADRRSTSRDPVGRPSCPSVRRGQRQRSGCNVAETVTNWRSVAGAGGWLLETHVAGGRSAHPSSWLTFCG